MTQAKPNANATPARPNPESASRRFRVLDVRRGTTLRNRWGAWGLLAVGLIITVLTALYIKAGVESAAQREFDLACNEIRINIVARLEAAAQILRSGAAFFDAAETVSRGEWRAFTQRLQLEQHLPGIQGIGFALLIPREQLDGHVQTIRREGFPDYHVTPAGERQVYSTIIYLEPFSDRNLRAFGYDMLSEPVRRAAMERARDENSAALSGKVILVQETGEDVQAGVLMYVPVYRHGLPIETIEQRRAALQGWVYSPCRMTDLMRGTLGHWDVKPKGGPISLRVHDGDVLSADTLLYDSRRATDRAPASTALSPRLTPVDFAGHGWTLRFTEPGGLVSLADYGSVGLVLFGGTTSTLLVFGLMLWRQQRSRFDRDKAEADESLRASENKFRSYVENAPDGVFIADDKGRYLEVNKAACQMTGYSQQEFEHLSILDLLSEESMETGPAQFQAVMETGALTTDLGLRRRDGSTVYVALAAVKLSGTRVLGFTKDITARKRAEAERLTLLAGLQQQKQLAAMGTLARGMAHEINNPIMGVTNYAELIKEQAAGNAMLVEYATEILTEGRRVARMTQSLLGFTEKRAETAFETATLEDLVAAVLPPAAEAARAKGIALSCDIPADLPPVSWRQGQLGQVVMALLANAMEAFDTGTLDAGRLGGEGKKIVVSAREVGVGEPSSVISEPSSVISDQLSVTSEQSSVISDQLSVTSEQSSVISDQLSVTSEQSSVISDQLSVISDQLSVTSEQSSVSSRLRTLITDHSSSSRWLRLTVEDNGPGVPNEIRERVFDPFFTTKDRTKHSGLGLWICRSIVQEHGGTLTYESEAGHGARFHVDLPVE